MTPYTHKQLASGAAVIVAALLAVGCGKNQDQAGWWQGEQQRIELSHQLELKKYRFEQAYSRDFEQLQKLRRSTSATFPLLISLRQQRLALGERIESLEGQWAGFRESTIREQRQHAMSKTFDKFSLVSGRTFAEVSVASIDDSGVTIRHADGSARLRFADLDARQRVYFGLEADLALAAEEQESRDAADYERWVAARMVVIDEKKLKDSENARRDELEIRRLRAESAARLAANSNVRPLARPATNVGDRSWSYTSAYSNYRAYRPAYRYVYYYNTPSYNYCQPSPYTVYPGRATRPYVYTPPVVPSRKSFADTTIPSIP
jgi:mRNA-degrading endonuclease YafQ of YafQ-DinJ toxin-antitoxin module